VTVSDDPTAICGKRPERGTPLARYALGYRAFERGDYQEAIEWWNQAADHGLQIAAEALENLRADLAGWADRE
jgi:TPR repeat protein